MVTLFKPINLRMLFLALAMNILMPLYYLYLHLFPKQGFFGSSISFMYSLLLFPLFIFLISFRFKNLMQKILFNILSAISVYIMLFSELIKTDFDSVVITLLIIYATFPFVGALLAHLISRKISKIKK